MRSTGNGVPGVPACVRPAPVLPVVRAAADGDGDANPGGGSVPRARAAGARGSTAAAAVTTPEVLWTPPADIRTKSRIGAYLAWLERNRGLRFDSYDLLWRWSVADLDGFWSSIWDYFGVTTSSPFQQVLSERSMPGARWFAGATVNYAEHALRTGPAGAGAGAAGAGAGAAEADRPAIIAHSQTRSPVTLTRGELRDQVARARRGLQRLGVGAGDCVAAYLPNIGETVVAFLAAASLGAVWSSCSPEFGMASVVDRFSQIEPKVLLGVDGYATAPRASTAARSWPPSVAALPTVRATVVVPYLGARGAAAGHSWRRAVGRAAGWRPCTPAGVRCRCRSTIRCTSCTHRARPGCRNPSSTATAGSCSST